jgi:hypothetical protein
MTPELQADRTNCRGDVEVRRQSGTRLSASPCVNRYSPSPRRCKLRPRPDCGLRVLTSATGLGRVGFTQRGSHLAIRRTRPQGRTSLKGGGGASRDDRPQVAADQHDKGLFAFGPDDFPARMRRRATSGDSQTRRETSCRCYLIPLLQNQCVNSADG